jgi:hypothetical protein
MQIEVKILHILKKSFYYKKFAKCTILIYFFYYNDNMPLPPFIEKLLSVVKEQRKLIVPALALIGLIIFGAVSIPLVINHAPNIVAGFFRQVNSNTTTLVPLYIPRDEEFYLADEPDFLPEILSEREPRLQWTPDDALPFWVNPVSEEPEKWQERITTVIDELLKDVP